jgi:hypothetical protein
MLDENEARVKEKVDSHTLLEGTAEILSGWSRNLRSAISGFWSPVDSTGLLTSVGSP